LFSIRRLLAVFFCEILVELQSAAVFQTSTLSYKATSCYTWSQSSGYIYSDACMLWIRLVYERDLQSGNWQPIGIS